MGGKCHSPSQSLISNVLRVSFIFADRRDVTQSFVAIQISEEKGLEVSQDWNRENQL